MSLRYEIADCPVCGSGQARTISDSDDIRAELEQLWAFHTRRLRGDTPPELLHDRVAFSQAPPLRVAQCNVCSLLFRNPREKCDALVQLYSEEEPAPDALESLFRNQLPPARAQAQRLSRLVPSPQHGLEVGSYVGAFLAAAAERDWSFDGVDVNESANRFARQRGFKIASGTLDEVTGSDYDVVTFWNCFDQLPEPVAAVRRARDLLRPDGWLVLRVPNGAFYAAWRRLLASRRRAVARAVLAHNNLLGFPYRHGFTAASLHRLLADAGFTVISVAGDTLVPVADRWTRRWARVEERLFKSALRRLPASRSPWLEVYARAPGGAPGSR